MASAFMMEGTGKMRRRILGVSSGLLTSTLVLLSETASAQYVDGAGQFGLEGNVFTSLSMTMKTDAGDVDTSASDFGLLANGAGLAFGYGAAEIVSIGVHLGYLSRKVSVDIEGVEDDKVSGFVLYPRLDFVFVPGSSVRPFLGPALGWENVTTEAAGTKAKVSTFLYGVRAGLHLFADNAISIDPAVTASGVSGSYENDALDVKYDLSGFGFSISLGISGWFGGAASKPPTRGEPDTDQAEGATAAEAQAVEEDPVAAAPPPTDIDALAVGYRVAGGRGVRITGRPRKDGSHAAAHFTVPSAGPEVADCNEITIHADDESFEATQVRSGAAGGGFGRSRVVRALVPIQAIQALGEAQSNVWLEVCGDRWPVPPAARRELFRFANRFREQAEAYGTWKPRKQPEEEPVEVEAVDLEAGEEKE
jgi:hypothetical protein